MKLTKAEFKNYLEERLENKSFEEVTIAVSAKDEEYSTYYFIQPHSIADIDMILYGSYGGHASVINLDGIHTVGELEEQLEDIIATMSDYGDYEYYIIHGIQ